MEIGSWKSLALFSVRFLFKVKVIINKLFAANIKEVLMLHSKLDGVQINSGHNFISLKMSSTFKQTGANAILCVEKLFNTLQVLILPSSFSSQ